MRISKLFGSIIILAIIMWVIKIMMLFMIIQLFHNNNTDKLPEYCYKKESWRDPVSNQDVTEYTKYYYTEEADEKFKSGKTYVQISNSNEVKSYFENFINVLSAFKKEEDFNFNLNDIDANDYVYIYNESNNPETKFYDYSIYYYDTGKHISYYIHSNI